MKFRCHDREIPRTVPRSPGHRKPASKDILDPIDLRQFAICNHHFDYVEPPRQLARPQKLQPRIRTTFDEPLFVFSNGVQTAKSGTFATGFHLNEQQ
jgi:hypothetical protein